MKNTREQNFETVEELKMFLGVNQLIDEILKYLDSDTRSNLEEDITNLWDTKSIYNLDSVVLLDEIVKYFDSSKMQEILEDIKNLWIWL